MPMGGSKPKPAPLPVAPPVEQDVSPEVMAARSRARKAAQAAVGRGGTILTGPAGLTQPATIGVKSLLGA